MTEQPIATDFFAVQHRAMSATPPALYPSCVAANAERPRNPVGTCSGLLRVDDIPGVLQSADTELLRSCYLMANTRFGRTTQLKHIIAIAITMLPIARLHAQSFNGRNIVYGSVITATRCHNRFTVNTRHGYSIIDYIGGQPVIEQDLLDGDMETVGPTLLVNKTRRGTIEGYVEQSRLSLSQFEARRRELCK